MRIYTRQQEGHEILIYFPRQDFPVLGRGWGSELVLGTIVEDDLGFGF